MKKFMNVKKVMGAFMALGAVVGLCSCDSKDDAPNNPGDVQQSIVAVGATGAESSVEFDAAEAWNAYVEGSANWLTVAPTKGQAGKNTIKVATANNNTTEARTAKVIASVSRTGLRFLEITVTQEAGKAADPEPDPETPYDPMNPAEEDHPQVGNMDSDALTLISNIKVGWNIGNTCEGTPNENSWGNPYVTAELIAAVKAAGFNAVRVPVRWTPHADDDMNIKAEWLDRIAEIVDYCVDQDMYVIINSHHDNWYDRLPSTYDAKDIKTKFANMWTQIARRFRDYDEHLIFGGINEMVGLNGDGSENWGQPTKSQQKFLNELMQCFVNNVRATSGNNAVRCLMIQPWACNPDFVLNGSNFEMPADKVAGRLIFEYHHYTWTYSTEAAGADQNKYFWGEPYKAYTPWYADGEKEEVWRSEALKKEFIDKGYGVIMAEFGCVQHNRSSDNAVADESRAYYHETVVSEAGAQGIPCFYWDNGLFTTADNENFGIFDRKNGNVVPDRAQIALDGIMRGLNK